MTHPAATNNPAAASGSHGISSGGIGHHGAPAANHSSSLLWTKTQQLPEDLFRQASGNAIIPQITKILHNNDIYILVIASFLFWQFCF